MKSTRTLRHLIPLAAGLLTALLTACTATETVRGAAPTKGPVETAAVETTAVETMLVANTAVVHTAVPLPNETAVPTRVHAPTPEPSTLAEAIITLDEATLKDLTYDSEWTASGKAPLSDGAYSEAAAPDSAARTTVSLHELMAFGTAADGRPFAAAILVTSGGGSGTFYDLALVVAKEGRAEHVASVRLGDRVRIESLTIEEDEVVLEMVQQGPDDPMCCPTQRAIERYALQGESLVQLDSQIVAAGHEGVVGPIGITWEWERFEGANDSVIEVAEPERYTLTLQADGTFQARADCNRGSGTYVLDGQSLLMELGALTRATCPPGSLHDVFVRDLGDVRTYVMAGDKLVLNLWADAGNMIFRRTRGGSRATPCD